MRLAMVLLLVTGVARACPTNDLSVGCYPHGLGYSSSLAAAQIGGEGVVAWSDGQPCVRGCYDLPAGTLVAVGNTNTQGGCSGGVRTSDLYTLLGPGSAPVGFEAVLRLTVTMPEGNHYQASLDGPGGASAQAADTPSGELAIPLSIVPGTPFAVAAALSAYGDEQVRPITYGVVSGAIRFRGLPEGYSLVSCQNYDVPTAAKASTWGGVKALYR